LDGTSDRDNLISYEARIELNRYLSIFDKLIAEVESGEIGYDEALERTGVNRLLIEKRTATI